MGEGKCSYLGMSEYEWYMTAAVATNFLLCVAPLPTFIEIIKRGSTGQFSSLPYVVSLIDRLFAIWYDLPFVSPADERNVVVFTLNIITALIESGYLLTFWIYAPKEDRRELWKRLKFIAMIFFTFAVVPVIVFDEKKQIQTICGYVSTLASVATYAAPMSMINTVIKTRSVQFMPLMLSVFVTFSAGLWFTYGLCEQNKFTYMAHGFGCAFGVFQLSIYAAFSFDYSRFKGWIAGWIAEPGSPQNHQAESRIMSSSLAIEPGSQVAK